LPRRSTVSVIERQTVGAKIEAGCGLSVVEQGTSKGMRHHRQRHGGIAGTRDAKRRRPMRRKRLRPDVQNYLLTNKDCAPPSARFADLAAAAIWDRFGVFASLHFPEKAWWQGNVRQRINPSALVCSRLFDDVAFGWLSIK